MVSSRGDQNRPLCQGLPLHVREIRASGGGARSPLWRQILADVFGTELVTVNVTEGAAYGAALLAGVGAQVYHSVEDACARTVKITGSTEPTADAAVYDAYYPRYRALYPALAGEFAALAQVGVTPRLARQLQAAAVRRDGYPAVGPGAPARVQPHPSNPSSPFAVSLAMAFMRWETSAYCWAWRMLVALAWM